MELLVDHFVDQRTISAKHPQANGLAERCVQSLKSALTKMIEGGTARENWEHLVAYVALGQSVAARIHRVVPLSDAVCPAAPAPLCDKGQGLEPP